MPPKQLRSPEGEETSDEFVEAELEMLAMGARNIPQGTALGAWQGWYRTSTFIWGHQGCCALSAGRRQGLNQGPTISRRIFSGYI